MYLIIHGAILDSTDVQSVNITVVDESAIVDIQCLFIHGSDALGCKVVLVSEYQDEVVIIKRNDTMSASWTYTLTHPVSCYSRVFAFDNEANDTFSTLSIEGNFQPRNTLCSGMMYCKAVINYT